MNVPRLAIVPALSLGLGGCATTDFLREQYQWQREEPIRGDVVIVTLINGEQLRTTFEARDSATLHTGDARLPLNEASTITIDQRSFRNRVERVSRFVIGAFAWSMLVVMQIWVGTL